MLNLWSHHDCLREMLTKLAVLFVSYLVVPQRRVDSRHDHVSRVRRARDQGLDCAAPHSIKIKVVPPPERKYLIWMGELILSSPVTFQHKWILKGEYDESDPT